MEMGRGRKWKGRRWQGDQRVSSGSNYNRKRRERIARRKMGRQRGVRELSQELKALRDRSLPGPGGWPTRVGMGFPLGGHPPTRLKSLLAP
jgi:hypothetical protein